MRELVPACPPGCVPIEQQRPQSLRRAVHGRRESGRSRADDDEVVELQRSRQRLAQAFGHLPRLRVPQHGSIFEEQDRKVILARAGGVEQRAGVGIARDVEPVDRG